MNDFAYAAASAAILIMIIEVTRGRELWARELVGLFFILSGGVWGLIQCFRFFVQGAT